MACFSWRLLLELNHAELIFTRLKSRGKKNQLNQFNVYPLVGLGFDKNVLVLLSLKLKGKT